MYYGRLTLIPFTAPGRPLSLLKKVGIRNPFSTSSPLPILDRTCGFPPYRTTGDTDPPPSAAGSKKGQRVRLVHRHGSYNFPSNSPRELSTCQPIRVAVLIELGQTMNLASSTHELERGSSFHCEPTSQSCESPERLVVLSHTYPPSVSPPPHSAKHYFHGTWSR